MNQSAFTNAPAAEPPAEPKAKGLRAPGEWRVLDARGYEEVTGERYYIRYPARDDELARLLRGEQFEGVEYMRAFAGEIAKGIPAVSLDHLIAAGEVVKANGPDDPYAKAAPKSEVTP